MGDRETVTSRAMVSRADQAFTTLGQEMEEIDFFHYQDIIMHSRGQIASGIF